MIIVGHTEEVLVALQKVVIKVPAIKPICAKRTVEDNDVLNQIVIRVPEAIQTNVPHMVEVNGV
jgi:hypothetical protein